MHFYGRFNDDIKPMLSGRLVSATSIIENHTIERLAVQIIMIRLVFNINEIGGIRSEDYKHKKVRI